MDIIRFYALRARSGGRNPQRRKFKMADGLAGPVSQSSAVKPTLPTVVITSNVIVVGAQGALYLTPRRICVTARVPCFTWATPHNEPGRKPLFVRASELITVACGRDHDLVSNGSIKVNQAAVRFLTPLIRISIALTIILAPRLIYSYRAPGASPASLLTTIFFHSGDQRYVEQTDTAHKGRRPSNNLL
ncbi:hypothetical protein ElyMa_003065600 [Elysia marginata]|uniref:Uncharacterized protein n=1 Tax=Elysia marginata TaxID=1093978 RepID=A0AAV4ILB4_9GAST|nr:hypothetical protein ElyMa_003065600 [Elysia marginata]